MFILKDDTMKVGDSNADNGYSKLNLWNIQIIGLIGTYRQF